MIATTIASGTWHQKIAAITVPLMAHCTGLRIDVVGEAADPYLAKLSIPLDEPVVFFDCDIVLRQRLDVTVLERVAKSGAFVAPRFRWREALKRKAKPGVSVDDYMSSGLFVAGPAHAEAFALARELYAGELSGALYHDEQPLNAALTRLGIARHYLPDNTVRLMVGPTAGKPDDVARHYTSWNEPRLRYRRVVKAAVEAWRNLGEPLPQELFRAVRALGIGGPASAPIRPPNL